MLEVDFHQPTAAARHGLEPLPGLAEPVTHQVLGECATQKLQVTTRENGSKSDRTLDVIVAGATPPNPVELMESEEMARLFKELSDGYDLVIVDTPPVSVLADAIPLNEAGERRDRGWATRADDPRRCDSAPRSATEPRSADARRGCQSRTQEGSKLRLLLRSVGVRSRACPSARAATSLASGPPGAAAGAGGALQPQRLRDDVALNLRGAPVDGRDQRLPHQPLHVVLRGVAVAAHHLHPAEGGPLGGLGDE